MGVSVFIMVEMRLLNKFVTTLIFIWVGLSILPIFIWWILRMFSSQLRLITIYIFSRVYIWMGCVMLLWVWLNIYCMEIVGLRNRRICPSRIGKIWWGNINVTILNLRFFSWVILVVHILFLAISSASHTNSRGTTCYIKLRMSWKIIHTLLWPFRPVFSIISK